MSKKGVGSRSLLQEISIRGLGVIDHASVEFQPGLNVITGETGAGKTMLLTALSLILGGKADSDLVRSGQERASITGEFIIPDKIDSELFELLNSSAVDIEDGSLILTRNINKDGKSKAVAGGIPTTAAFLTEASSRLIEIHGQHANLVLAKANKQREMLDGYAGEVLADALISYREKLSKYLELSNQIKELNRSLKDKDRLIAKLQEIESEYKKLKPRDGELADLDVLISRLESVEDLRVGVTGALSALSDEDAGALNSLQHAKRYLYSLKGKDPELDKLHERVSDALFNLVDSEADLTRYLEGLSADPAALETALQRKSLLTQFAKKHGESSDRLIAYQEAIAAGEGAAKKIAELSGGDESVDKLRKECEALRIEVLSAARLLTEIRTTKAKEFSDLVEAELRELSMPKARLQVLISSKSADSDSDLTPHGVDEVGFLFSAHGGTDLLPISKAASGGELSRLMLGIEVVIADTYPLGTYIFDEVDAGIGGKAALDVGRRLKKLAKQAQVIVVTHLPQVAIWADHHIVVEKNIEGAVTESTIRALTEEQRELEIARMLSGLQDSEHAQEHARELLNLPLAEKA